MFEVIQSDRAAAVDLMLPLCRGDHETAAVCKALLGECDETGPVQAFAQYRHKARAELAAEITAMIGEQFDAPHILDAGRKIANDITRRFGKGQ